MKNLYIFESGSTKTAVLVAHPSKNEGMHPKSNMADHNSFSLSGYNPNRPNDTFITQLTQLPITPADEIHFYGSGLGDNNRKEELKQLFFKLFQVSVRVYDDVLGAARALYGSEKGIALIMGTGGIAAYYNGEEVVDRCGGYGYLIDDFGGGYELGKYFISAWLNGDLPNKLDAEIQSQIKIPKSTFIHQYYSNSDLAYSQKGLKLVASVVECISSHINDKQVRQILSNYFDFFFQKNVVSLSRRSNTKELRVAGSVMEFFAPIITETAVKFEMNITKTIRYPALTLLAYHLTTNKT